MTQRVWLYTADSIEFLKTTPDCWVDAVVCDPPYGLEFMGKEWDSLKAPTGGARFSEDGMGKGFNALPSYRGSPNPSCLNCGGSKRGRDRKGFKRCACDNPSFPNSGLKQSQEQQEWHRRWAVEAFRVLKPGGHIVAFGGSRTYHRLACALEDAGFEIRDSLMWIYLNGFPKSLNVGKAIDATVRFGGSGSQQLRARDGFDVGTVGTNMHKHRSGANDAREGDVAAVESVHAKRWEGWGTALKPAHEPCVLARKPLDGTVAANVMKWGTGALNIDASKTNERWPANVIVGEDAAPEFTKYFYCPKVSRAERDTGCEHLASKTAFETVERDPDSAGAKNPRAGAGRGAGAPTQECAKCGKNVDGGRAVQPCSAGGEHEIVAGEPRPGAKNHHPTVKPVALMRWLIRLVTPPGGIVLDPFMGSGSTGVAAMLEGMRFVGIDREAEYAEIAHARISAWERFK